MKKKLYSVYDAKIKTYENPFFLRSKGEALRGWIDIVNDTKSKFNKHPGDYTLFELAEYDEETGKIEAYTAPESVATAIDVMKEIDGNEKTAQQ